VLGPGRLEAHGRRDEVVVGQAAKRKLDLAEPGGTE